MLSAKLLLAAIVAVAVLGTTFATTSFGPPAQAENKEKLVQGHAFESYVTTGDVLDPEHQDSRINLEAINPDRYLREFNYGRVSTLADGTTLREFTIIADDSQTLEVSPGIFYNAWTFNGTIPGPTIRATEGDLLRINFVNNGSKSHTMHFHSIHEAQMDGVFEIIAPGGKFTYEFTAEPYGLFLYHCHVQPIEEHIAHGLYGVYIIDPKEERPQADELVMLMNGYDTDFDTENNFYTVNGVPYYYMHHPIQIEKNKLVRVYLVNMLEYDPLNNFHLHANMFNYYPSGTNLQPDVLTDIVSLNQADRGIMEFKYKFPGKYMFHAHKTEFAEKGWMGTFIVKDGESGASTNNGTSSSNFYNALTNSYNSGYEKEVSSAKEVSNSSNVPISSLGKEKGTIIS